ncbi:MAG: DTW domain-containing protein [Myxococcales bacterium]|nr:DTW domain-containing protein [Myxococcales bacterium]
MTGRPFCYRCMKPAVTCVCARLPRVDNQTRIWVLQHPRERRHPIGTVRLLALALERVRVDVTFLSGPRGPLPAIGPRAALLYPAPGARALESLSRDEQPDELIVLDGTWHHAHTLARDLGFLAVVPKVTLESIEPSRYRIRREPRGECVSTVEAVVAALRVLEPETRGLGDLLQAFDEMIDDQLGYIERRPGPRRAKRRRTDGARGVARVIADRWDDLLIAYAESAPGPGQRALVQLVGVRVASGETFDQIVAGPPPSGLFHMRLSEHDRATGASEAQLAAAWSAFRRPRDVVLAWNQSTLDLLAAASLDHGGLCLKALWANAFERGPGTLEAVVERARLTPRPAAVRGRSADRLGNAVCIAQALRARVEQGA